MIHMDKDLCIPLYITAKTFRNEHSKHLKKLGLTFTQFIVMMVLWDKDELMVKEIGSRLDLDSGTLTPVLKKLEDKGYVVRRQSEEDARDVMIRLTEEGRKLQTRVEQSREKLFEERIMDAGKSERIRFLLTELITDLKDIMNDGGAADEK